MKIFHFFLPLPLAIISFFAVGIFLSRQNKAVPQLGPKFTPETKAYQLNPLPGVEKGMMATRSGVILKTKRGSSKYEQYDGGEVLMAEKIALKNATSSAVINFPKSKVILSLSQKAELSFENLLPGSLLFKQLEGEVKYDASALNGGIAVRAISYLLDLQTGLAVVTVDPDKKAVKVSLVSGRAKIGYVDENDKTTITSLTPGQSFTGP